MSALGIVAICGCDRRVDSTAPPTSRATAPIQVVEADASPTASTVIDHQAWPGKERWFVTVKEAQAPKRDLGTDPPFELSIQLESEEKRVLAAGVVEIQAHSCGRDLAVRAHEYRLDFGHFDINDHERAIGVRYRCTGGAVRLLPKEIEERLYAFRQVDAHLELIFEAPISFEGHYEGDAPHTEQVERDAKIVVVSRHTTNGAFDWCVKEEHSTTAEQTNCYTWNGARYVGGPVSSDRKP